MKKSMLHIAALLLMLLCSSCITEEDELPAGLQPGDTCPQFEITMADGTTVSTTSLAGHTTIIVFFNTTCPDCRAELPVIQQVYDEISLYPTARILCIARAETAQSIRDYWNANSLTLPYSPQPDAAIYSLFATSIIPRIYIISPTLTITAVYTDYPLPTASQLLSHLSPPSPSSAYNKTALLNH